MFQAENASFLRHMQVQVRSWRGLAWCLELFAGVAQLVERNLAKVEVESSRLFSRSRLKKGKAEAFPFFVLCDLLCHCRVTQASMY